MSADPGADSPGRSETRALRSPMWAQRRGPSGRRDAVGPLSRTARTAGVGTAAPVARGGRLWAWSFVAIRRSCVRCLVVRCCAERGRARPGRPHRDLDLPRLDPRFVPQKSAAVRYRNGVIAYPTTAPLVLNYPLAELIRGFCKQGVRGSSPLGSTAGHPCRSGAGQECRWSPFWAVRPVDDVDGEQPGSCPLVPGSPGGGSQWLDVVPRQC